MYEEDDEQTAPESEGVNLRTPLTENDDTDKFFEKQRGRIEGLYDNALAQLRERYRGPDQSDLLLSIGAALMAPTADGKLTSSLANLPSVLLKYKQGRREADNDLEDMAMRFNLAKGREVSDIDQMAFKYGLKGSTDNTEAAKMLRSAGFQEGTPEWQEAMVQVIEGKYGAEYVDDKGNIRKRSIARLRRPGGGGLGASQGNAGLPLIDSDEAYDALRPGAQFRDPQGNVRKKPGGGGPTQNASGDFQSFKRAIIGQETGGRYGIPNAEGSGAMGIGQVMPDTARALAKRIGVAYRPDLMAGKHDEARKYQDAITDAALQEAWKAGQGDVNAAAMYYHGGSNREGWGRKTQGYGRDIRRRMGIS